MDTSKGRRGVGYGRFRGVRKTLETETSSPIETKAPLLETKKNETRFSPQSQGKQLTPYATMILSTTFRKTISKGPIYNQESKRNEDN